MVVRGLQLQLLLLALGTHAAALDMCGSNGGTELCFALEDSLAVALNGCLNADDGNSTVEAEHAMTFALSEGGVRFAAASGVAATSLLKTLVGTAEMQIAIERFLRLEGHRRSCWSSLRTLRTHCWVEGPCTGYPSISKSVYPLPNLSSAPTSLSSDIFLQTFAQPRQATTPQQVHTNTTHRR
eukprot:TRINITY_DN1298_c0_g1_i1.p1 TRINITY_DN1298_c0_g1~~TRINITY_DN1298_c0_g1_i1.p1  ORF type:complete len:203 (+),score=22.28 TRINITY_DN1298_c0_g1_i1:63-611(+)